MGFTASIDNLCIGQHQFDQANVAEVIRHLVDEKRRTLPMNLGVADIFLTERGQLLPLRDLPN